MSVDKHLLRIMKHRKDYSVLIHAVPQNALDKKTKLLIRDFGKYFEKFPDHSVIDLGVFVPRFKQWHTNFDEEQHASYRKILQAVKEDVDESTRAGILTDLYEHHMGTQIANALAQYEEGDLKLPLSDIVSSSLDEYKIQIGAKMASWDDTSIEDLLQDDQDNSGLKWRLKCLRESMRGLRSGDFIIVAGRPDNGKTSFLSSESTFLAPQLPEDRNVLWLNNEGPSGRIVKRIYQAALGKTITELVEMEKEKKGRLRRLYEKKVGRVDRIRVVNIHGFHVGQVEAIIEKSSPGIIIYDMIDKIHGFSSDARTDLQLEQMYDWARERCVKYDTVGIATSQISAEGEGLQFPGLSMLKDSKTGKQGACDAQIMIGSSTDTTMEHSRFISLPKNKLRRDGMPGDPRAEVIFNKGTGRYEDINDGE